MHGPEAPLAPSWDGSVILEIGGEFGALMLRTPASMLGEEIDLDPEDNHVPRTHSAVRERRGDETTTYAAVYPSLRAGTYAVEGSGQRVTIVGGEVLDLEWARAPAHPTTEGVEQLFD